MKKLLLTLLAAALCGPAFAEPVQPLITLKDGDVWVMAGDSITAGRLHSNYIEAFFRTRHPNLRLHFRNAGVSGHTAQSTLERFDADIAGWKPTIVSIEFGMNDSNKATSEVYIECEGKLVAQTRALGAQPLLISSSPINDGSRPGRWHDDWNGQKGSRIDSFTNDLKALAEREGVPFVDQFHPLVEVWARNKPLDVAGFFLKAAETYGDADDTPEVRKIKAAAKLLQGLPEGVPVTSITDTIHPGPIGQYMMAATILKGLGVDGEVSSAKIDAKAQKLVSASRCKITDLTYADGRLAFKRLDERLPWPNIGADTAKVAQLLPDLGDLSRYLLTVTGLPKGSYSVRMDGEVVATLTDKELAAGWNMSLLTTGPVYKRLYAINGLIGSIQGKPNMEWREASKAKDAEKMAAAQKQIDELEEKLQAALQPAGVAFEIAPTVAKPAK